MDMAVRGRLFYFIDIGNINAHASHTQPVYDGQSGQGQNGQNEFRIVSFAHYK